MKKIININLSGRVIPIEDSAYESLQRYIESLRRFFMNEEGRDEIINDIESRIAELMNDKIKKGAAAVTDADMEEIINSMGRIEDFEQTDATEATTNTGSQQGSYSGTTGKRFSGRLYRDGADKYVGGVCSGIASYLNIDPSIVRLLFVLFVFGGGTGFLVYIILWIVLPIKPLTLDEEPRPVGKRLFRNPDDRIIGGVAGGLAAYFIKEAWLFRVVFAAPLILNILFGILHGIFSPFHRDFDMFPNFFFGSFTGTFIITYVILWIILPEAKTPYDKMEMRGENVDVNTIRQNVQEGMNDFKSRMQTWGEEVKTSAQELGGKAKAFANTRGKEFGAEVSQGGRRVGNSVAHVLGVLVKAFVLFIAGSIAFGLFLALIAVVFGGGMAMGSAKQHILNFFLDGFWQHAFFWGTAVFFFLVPFVAFITWLVRRIMKIRSRRHYLGYIFGGLWTLGVICLLSLIFSLVRDAAKGDRLEQPMTISQPANGKLLVTVAEPAIRYSGDLWFVDDNDAGWDLTEDTMKLSDVRIRVVQSEDSTYSVNLQRYSRGGSRAAALARASKIQYPLNSRDSVLQLGSGFAIDRESKYRGQRLVVEIRVPVGKKIYFDQSVVDKLQSYNIRIKTKRWKNRRQDTDWDWDYDNYFDWKPGVDYIMGADGSLEEAGLKVDSPVREDSNIDSIQRVIDERKRQNEMDQRKLEEIKDRKDNSTTAVPQRKRRQIPIAIPYIPTII
jgi:phage shock protein PspC (stress-responsive transcriptional regulator)